MNGTCGSDLGYNLTTNLCIEYTGYPLVVEKIRILPFDTPAEVLIMALDKSRRRLPLRELLSDAERRTRAAIELLNTQLLQRVAELSDLSRGHHRKKGPTTVIALLHAIDRVVHEANDLSKPLDELHAELEEIHEHANRERFNR